jgi:carboxylesterase type B
MSKVRLFSLFILLQIGTSLAAPEVQLPDGPIRGREGSTFTNKQYYIFEKIPYATPPVGELRFKAPIPPPSWDEPLDTVNLDVTCYQQNANSDAESEDCLYINVYTPQLPSEDETVALPVMLYIHGGGFIGGSGRGVHAERIINEDVVFAAINYRLGPFGFMSTQDEVIPGNNGLKDQHLALQWAHDNIHLFGGDPDKITIFGQSAGSASVAYHLINQNSKDLFRGAILQSGSFLSPWAFQRKSKEIAFATAAFLNDTFQTNSDSNALLEFLQGVDAKSLDVASEQYANSVRNLQTTEILQGFYWAPVVEVKNPDAFLTKKMYGLLQAGNVVGVPILMGMTSEEGLAYNQNADTTLSQLTSFDEHLDWLVPNDMQVPDEDKRIEVGRSIRDIYTGGEDLADHVGDGVRYWSDQSFTRSIIRHAEFYSTFAETYFYQFSHDGELGKSKVHYDGAEHVGHSGDNAYIFCAGSGCDVSGYPEADQITVDRVIKIWTNFAKYQNPTPEPSELLQNVTWPQVSTEDGDFYYVDIRDDLEIKNHPKEATYSKWVELYDSLGFSDFDTF